MGLDMFLNKVTGEELGYWRKANAVHGYIVKHFADNVDNCEPVRLSRENLAQLRKDCLIVIADKHRIETANTILPPTSGFFFGSTEIDDYYYDDLMETVKIIDSALDSKTRVFIYRASW